jgi:hypothetical protein
MKKESIILTIKEAQRLEVSKRTLRSELTGNESAKQLALYQRQVQRLKATVQKLGLASHAPRLRAGPMSPMTLPVRSLKIQPRGQARNHGGDGL